MIASLKCVLPGWVLVLAPTMLAAQESVLIPDEVACACRLRAELVTTLSDVDGSAGLSSPLVIERTGDGHYLVVPSNRQGTVLLFDPSGRYIRAVGRSGAGPEEFSTVLSIRPGPADSIVILDGGNGRLAVLDSVLRPVRVARTAVTGGWFGVLDDGQVVIMTGIPRLGGESLDRIRVFSPSMAPVRSFMRSTPTGPNASVEDLRRRMAVSGRGDIAVSHWNRYTVEIWDISGRHRRTLRRNPTWFQHEVASRLPGNEPIPVLETPRWDRQGRLWIVAHIADPRWREALAPRRDLYGREIIGVMSGSRDQYYDSIVEVIDPDAGTLLGTLRIDAQVEFISGDGFAASYREDAIGFPFIDIWKFELLQ